jgi:hypothetical protein
LRFEFDACAHEQEHQVGGGGFHERDTLRQTEGLDDTRNAVNDGDCCAKLDASLLRDRLV